MPPKRAGVLALTGQTELGKAKLRVGTLAREEGEGKK